MKKAVKIAAAWLPFLALWQMFAVQAGAKFMRALPFSFYAIGSAAMLGLVVWHFCARVPWPHELRARFYAAHIFGAAAFAGVWAAGMLAFAYALERKLISRGMTSGWVIEGVWLYAIVAGASYTMQTQRRALQAEKGLAVARLDALRSRLHPHFLFNALHTVGALVRHDPAEAEGAIEKLGDMLRYTLRDGEGDVVPFAEEWEFTRRYLEFEQLRYGDRLRVTSDIDPRALDYTTPSFALQTLVENSVRHSIAQRAEGGRVEISARVGDERLHIRVRDDGGNGVKSEPGGQYGLSALRERLDAAYGAPLHVTRDDFGFEVSFAIPCTRLDDDE